MAALPQWQVFKELNVNTVQDYITSLNSQSMAIWQPTDQHMAFLENIASSLSHISAPPGAQVTGHIAAIAAWHTTVELGPQGWDYPIELLSEEDANNLILFFTILNFYWA